MGRVRAYALRNPKARFELTHVDRRPVGDRDVRITILYSGICHSDIHAGRGDWQDVHFPLIPGHEITGIVAEVGSAVKSFRVGDPAGVGVMVGSCETCQYCLSLREQLCIGGGWVGTYNGILDGEPTAGGYSQEIVVNERFALHIPPDLTLCNAAPILCAGLTMYVPLRRWMPESGANVGIVGLGGLGHLGVKIASAMGGEVTVFSRTRQKEDDARRFGATNFVATEEQNSWTELISTFDLIITTASVSTPMDDVFDLVRPHGVVVSVGLPRDRLTVNPFSLINGSKVWAGSEIGSVKDTQEALDYCAIHDISPEIEVIRASELDQAWDKTADGEVRYRFVIDASTI